MKSKQLGKNASFSDLKVCDDDVFMELSCQLDRTDFKVYMTSIKDACGESGLIDIYAYRTNDSCVMIGQFYGSPNLPDDIQGKLLTTSDLKELDSQQVYKFEGKNMALAFAPLKYAPEFYLAERRVKHFKSLSVFNVYDRNEFTLDLNCPYADAIIVTNEDSNSGETFYAIDSWSVEARYFINKEAELAYELIGENKNQKTFRNFAPNDIVLLKYGGYVRRACILWHGKKLYEVLCVDYGTRMRCSSNAVIAAPAHIAKIPFLAVPCCLQGLDYFIPPGHSEYVAGYLNQISLNIPEFKFLGKNNYKNLFRIDILVKNQNDERIGLVKLLHELHLIEKYVPFSEDRIYDFSRMLDLSVNAVKLDLTLDPEIQCEFVNPSEFLITNSLAKKLSVATCLDS